MVIVGKTKQAIWRLKLFQQIGQGTQKFAVWYKKVYKQAMRCDWTTYNVEEAARDAIMYQTSDQKLRKESWPRTCHTRTPWTGASHTRSQTGKNCW